MNIRKIACVFFETLAVCLFIMILCVNDFTSYKAFFGLLAAFTATATIAIILDNPHRIGRHLFPAFICLMAFFYRILKPAMKLMQMCYKAKVHSGSYIQCYRDAKARYDEVYHVYDESEVVEDDEKFYDYFDGEDYYIWSADGRSYYRL